MSSCDPYRQLLLEAAPTDAASASLVAHIEVCASCAALARAIAATDEQAAGLVVELPPTRDLWPGIAQRLELRVGTEDRTLPRRRPEPARQPRLVLSGWRLAATLILVAGAAALAGRWLPPLSPSPAVDQESRGAGARPGLEVTEQAQMRGLGKVAPTGALDRGFLLVGDQLDRLYQDHGEQLTDETRSVIDANLAIIAGSLAEIRSALAADPNSTELYRDLDRLHRRRLDLLRRAITLPSL